MEAGLRTPMLDFFRRGEVARDVRMLAAQGAIAPRPMEQLGLLMILTRDHDSEVRQTAEMTLQQLPASLVANFIARSDVPSELREFFVGRGIHPSDTPAPDIEEALVDAGGSGPGDDAVEEVPLSFSERLATMTVPEKMKYAMKGTREMRAVLIRDPNRLVAAAVLSCPKVNEGEAEAFAKMGNVSEDILRSIAQNRAWTKNYGVTLSLCKNSKTPIALTLNMMQRLTEADVKRLSTDRNVPEPVRVAARKRVVQNMK
ncbi:MAG: hypothetical protein ABI039_08335 [Vicinamibacterales bacterium]